MLDFLAGYVMGERSAARAATFARAAGAASGATTTDDIQEVNERVDRLLLVVDAMWSLLREVGYSDEALAARIQELDGADGVLDGRRTPQPRKCSSCGSMVDTSRSTCAFCGAATAAGPGVLDTI